MSPDNEDTTNDSPLSMSEAVRAFTAPDASETIQQDQTTDADAQDEDFADDETLTYEASEDEGDTRDDEDQTDNDDDAEDEDADPESEQGRFVADNARVKLADGTFTTVAELKAGSLKNADYTQKTQAVAAKERELQSEREATTQLKLQTEQVRDYTIAVLEQFMPAPPDDALLNTDPFAHIRQEREYKAKKEQLDYLKAHREWEQQQAATQEQTKARETANAEWALLVNAMPELKDETRRNAVVSELFTQGKSYGFDEQEVRSALAFDHRQALVLSDAAKWRKLQAKKAETLSKVEGRPPVQRGGKRLNAQGQQQRQAKVAMERLNNEPTLKNGVAAYLATQSKG